MGIVSSAKFDQMQRRIWAKLVSIPDGDSFLREVWLPAQRIPVHEVSIPDGDSFLREDRGTALMERFKSEFQSPMGIVSSAKGYGADGGALCERFQSPMGIVSSAK